MNHNVETTPTISTGHLIRVKYHGPTNTRPSCYRATWEGWPSEDSKPVRRRIPYVSDRDVMACAAAEMFREWLNEGGTGLRHTVEHITIAGDNSEYCLAVKTKAHPRADHAIT